MKTKLFVGLSTLALVLVFSTFALADINNTVSFEGGLCFGDPNGLGYPGISFTNAALLYLSQGCLNPSFPPHSGDGVVFDSGSPIILTISEVEGGESGNGDTVSGYFTTNSTITMNAFDFSGALCDSVFFQGPNYVGSGGTPNAFLSVHCGEIASVQIFSSSGPDSFTMDDVTYPLSDVPEPATLVLVATAILGVMKKKFN